MYRTTRMWRVVVVVACLCVARARLNQCNREPPEAKTPKTPGDNGFKIRISGNPRHYFPSHVYTVTLEGWRTEYQEQKFRGFILAVEPSSSPGELYGPNNLGSFTLYSDALTMHSDHCPDTVTQTSSSMKSDIKVLWKAPPSNSGCITFKATVVESRDVWYKDDGQLTRELCEETLQVVDDHFPPILECCACNEAKYEVTFEGMWSRHTHPKNFPSNEWQTHYSDIIGASHSTNFRMWKYDGYASDGIKEVAEMGVTRTLEGELKRNSGDIRTIIKARGLWHPNVTGKTFAVFRVDNRHHLMSLVSKLAPTPDWIVGVSALELCLRNCSWLDHQEIDLFPWDAGTDSGIEYEAADIPTVPPEKIRKITNSYPNDPRSPFYDPTGAPMKPLARLSVIRHRLYEKSCDTLILSDYENDNDPREECSVTEWSPFSPCSASCGKGMKIRTRRFRMPLQAQGSQCKRSLDHRVVCTAHLPNCNGITGGAPVHQHFPAPRNNGHICATSEWTQWTPCIASCGYGLRIRNRHYVDRMGRKRCDKELVQKQICAGEVAVCPEEEEIPSYCRVTSWSEFSPCSASCGTGVTQRHRSFLEPNADTENCPLAIIDSRNCTSNVPDCSIHPDDVEVVCMLEKDDGPCRGSFIKWYYDTEQQTCLQFNYGGCRGNRNRFNTYEECVHNCKDHLLPSSNIGTRSHHRDGQRIDCVATPWTDWGPCSITCGRGWVTRTRRIEVQPQNGGRKCPKKLERRKKCRYPRCDMGNRFGGLESMSLRQDPPDQQEHVVPAFFNPLVPASGATIHVTGEHGVRVDCVMGEWGPWSPCTQSCGSEALQQRSRNIIVKPLNGGQQCDDLYQRRYCTLLACPRPRVPWTADDSV